MLIYWLMFAFPAAMALTERSEGGRRFGFAWLVAILGLVVLIGFRWETGGDWGSYNKMVEQALWTPRPLSLFGDPGFALLTEFAARSRFGILLVTLASGLVMGPALARFCLDQPRPWLSLAVAMPYFVVVMGMGYVRQGMAISLLLMALGSLRRGNLVGYSLWVAAGAMFHSTAFILLPLGVIATDRNAVTRVVFAAAIFVLLGYALVSARADMLVTNYVEAQMTSSGTAVRLVMTAVPGLILLLFRDRFALNGPERWVWGAFAYAAIAALVLLAIFPSSTVIDRMGLYLLPIQFFVYPRLPDAFASEEKGRNLIVLAVLAAYAAAFFVWLNYAVNVEYWLPYRSYFFEDGICLAC